MLLIMINDAGFAAPSTTDGQVRAKQAVIYGKREDRNGHAGQARKDLTKTPLSPCGRGIQTYKRGFSEASFRPNLSQF